MTRFAASPPFRRRKPVRRSCWNRASSLAFTLPWDTIVAGAELGSGDRRRLTGSEAGEVDDFARRHGLTADQVRALIARCGHDRALLEREAEKLRG